ncbi:hypothetical protein BEN49_16310 [Hymenobacter coccineus]|uniref:Uncharacterized protein n=2 Tax=Hymenobacter coccineus TaxID=1908235 RepID=A0A1G1SR03_9BACT|nr:hypothetical protein BEN49_16310 [Hymenobacter coccineus]
MNEALQLPLYKRYAPLLPVLVLAGCCISTIVTALGGTVELDGTTYGFALTTKHYGALAATAASVVSFFWLRKYYKYFLALIFVLGFCGLINFTVTQTSVGIGFDELRIGLSPLMLLFGVLVYATNSKKINRFLAALVKPSDKKIAQQQQEEVEEFKRKFSRKSTEELEQIVADNKLVANALSAARQLLRERGDAKIVA